tara:strand:+ start:31 stop:825 length:795 start_codon:yes stop_codon:yes gene_type:complete
MMRLRIIPCLLIHNGGLTKTVRFAEHKYVGDPLNAVRIFNEKLVDELIVLDIDASRNNAPPDMHLISELAAECRMPLCYGGGVTTCEQIEQIVSLGVEKVALSSTAVANPEVIGKAVERVGSQSVVVVMDVKKTGFLRSYEVVTHNGTRKASMTPAEFAQNVQLAGAGEIIVNSVDNDGKMGGYDLKLIDLIYGSIEIPMTVLGGARSLGDVEALGKRYPVIGAAAGSMFIFKGKYRAVLINYPTLDEKRELLASVEMHIQEGF